MKKIIDKIKKLDKKGKVKFVVVYGSSVKGRATKLSDIDIAVFYDGEKKERFNFRIKLSGELNNKYDVQIFQDLPLYIRDEIVKTGKVIYKSDLRNLSETYIKVIRDYSFFKKHIDLYYDNLRRLEVA